ncbi:MAG: hypothetical protein NT082_02715 [Chloroflexi bacterium]|nr:hypothetical protein [Chloroflexota bacterium]
MISYSTTSVWVIRSWVGGITTRRMIAHFHCPNSHFEEITPSLASRVVIWWS